MYIDLFIFIVEIIETIVEIKQIIVEIVVPRIKNLLFLLFD
jgi:hypothetical protein